MKDNYKFILKLGIILFFIVAVSTLALATVNYFTEDVIVEKNIQAQNEARQNVLPDADRFEMADKLMTTDEKVGINEELANKILNHLNSEQN